MRFLTEHLRKRHWNRVFSGSQDFELGWFENDSSQTMKFLDAVPHVEGSTVFLPGARMSG